MKAKSTQTPAIGHENQRREDEWKTEEKIVMIKARIHVFRQGILTRKRKTRKRKATPGCVCVCVGLQHPLQARAREESGKRDRAS